MDDILGIRNALPENLTFRSASGVSTDSRSVRRGEVFFALRGEKFDGHKFVRTAVGKGAACAVVDRKWYSSGERTGKLPLVVVPDTTDALGELARIYRKNSNSPS